LGVISIGIMRALAVFVLFFVAVYAQEEYCYDQVNKKCNGVESELAKCDSKYGAIDQHTDELIKYAQHHLESSHKYLLMSLNFGTFEKNRPGFEKLFRGLSDEKWADTIGLIKHVSKRGGDINWNVKDDGLASKTAESYDINEAPALAKAVDIEKKLATKAIDIHESAVRFKKHDGEIGHYIEEEFFEKHASNIRKLSGWVHDVLKFMKGDDKALGLYLFDEFLAKQ